MSRLELAYRAWRRAAERGYGSTTTKADADRIDARIRALKARYETALAFADNAALQRAWNDSQRGTRLRIKR